MSFLQSNNSCYITKTATNIKVLKARPLGYIFNIYYNTSCYVLLVCVLYIFILADKHWWELTNGTRIIIKHEFLCMTNNLWSNYCQIDTLLFYYYVFNKDNMMFSHLQHYPIISNNPKLTSELIFDMSHMYEDKRMCR